MRTTVEISDEQHRALMAVASRRGLRGFSALVQEAVEAYLVDMRADEVDALLGLEGVLDDEQTDEVRSRIEVARQTWRAS